MLKEVSDSNGKIVLFIDEIHTVVGAGATGGAMDAGKAAGRDVPLKSWGLVFHTCLVPAGRSVAL